MLPLPVVVTVPPFRLSTPKLVAVPMLFPHKLEVAIVTDLVGKAIDKLLKLEQALTAASPVKITVEVPGLNRLTPSVQFRPTVIVEPFPKK